MIESLIEIERLDRDQFLKVRETLTRIGITSKREGDDKPTLWQSCHVLHKRGKYYIVHFKSLFLLDGKEKKTDYTEVDHQRTLFVTELLSQWGLVKPVKPIPDGVESEVTIVRYADKHLWNLRAKYQLGSNRNP